MLWHRDLCLTRAHCFQVIGRQTVDVEIVNLLRNCTPIFAKRNVIKLVIDLYRASEVV